jgi:hypothetical protein
MGRRTSKPWAQLTHSQMALRVINVSQSQQGALEYSAPVLIYAMHDLNIGAPDRLARARPARSA